MDHKKIMSYAVEIHFLFYRKVSQRYIFNFAIFAEPSAPFAVHFSTAFKVLLFALPVSL